MRLMIAMIALLAAATSASAQSRARYYFDGEPHAGPALSGTMYDAAGRNVGKTRTHSDGSTTIYGNNGSVIGRSSTDSQGVTIFYDAAGRKTGTAVPNGAR